MNLACADVAAAITIAFLCFLVNCEDCEANKTCVQFDGSIFDKTNRSVFYIQVRSK